jgi:hypothetical protein
MDYHSRYFMQQKFISFKILEAGSLRSRCQHVWFLWLLCSHDIFPIGIHPGTSPFSHIELRSHIIGYKLNYLFKGPISKYNHNVDKDFNR